MIWKGALVVAVLGNFTPLAFDQTALVGPEVWNFFPRRFWMSVRQPKFAGWLHAHHLPVLSICLCVETSHPLSWEAS